MTLLVDVGSVRDYMALNSNPSTSQYSDQTISSNIAAAQDELEQVCGRYFVPRSFTTQNPWKTTSMLKAIVPIPGFRTFTSVQWGGATLTVDVNDPTAASCWALPDARQSGVFTGLQFRAFRTDLGGAPWYFADGQWWDKMLDSPFYPGNYGGGYAYTSMPNDTLIVGNAGYDTTLAPGVYGSLPPAVAMAVKVLASWHTMRPASVLTDVAVSPQGGFMAYSMYPPEVQAFIRDWKIDGPLITSVG